MMLVVWNQDLGPILTLDNNQDPGPIPTLDNILISGCVVK